MWAVVLVPFVVLFLALAMERVEAAMLGRRTPKRAPRRERAGTPVAEPAPHRKLTAVPSAADSEASRAEQPPLRRVA